MQTHVLIVEDDPTVTESIKRLLNHENMAASEARSARDMYDVLERERFDLILLDINLGSDNGVDLAREIRSRNDVPIIMVTGRHETVSRVAGLDAGADDYVTKPFTAAELMARVRSVLRRSSMSGSVASAERRETVTLGDLRFDPAAATIAAGDNDPIELTYLEALLFGRFLRTPNDAISRTELMRFAFGRDWTPDDRALDVHVSHLRRKLREAGSNDVEIRSARGYGYLLTGPVGSSKHDDAA